VSTSFSNVKLDRVTSLIYFVGYQCVVPSAQSIMASLANITETFCDWRSHLNKDDSIQAWDGKGWYAATICGVNASKDDLLVCFDNYSSKYDFWCSRQSRRIRPTIGYLRKKIMVPQAEEIRFLQSKNEALHTENDSLKQQLAELHSKYDTANYQYLPLKKLASSSKSEAHSQRKDAQNADSANFHIESQEGIEQLLAQNVRHLAEWNKTTKELEALHDELNDPHSAHNIKDLVRIQVMLQKRVETQQQRLECVQNEIISPVMSQKFRLDEKLREHQQKLQRVKEQHKEKLTRYDELFAECQQLMRSLHELVAYCNQRIERENELSKQQMGVKDEIGKLEHCVSEYTEFGASYFDTLKGFQKFQVLNQKYIAESMQSLHAGWQHIESVWPRWKCDDLLLWIQYKMDWLNHWTVPNYVDFDCILKQMQRRQMNGNALVTLTQNDLLTVGFKIYSHRQTIYKEIKALISKYRKVNDDVVSDLEEDEAVKVVNEEEEELLNDTQYEEDGEEVQREGHPTTRDDDGDAEDEVDDELFEFVHNERAGDVPEKYKCSLTQQVMSEPVVCGHDNKKYEKSAIQQYIAQNGDVPKLNKQVSKERINLDDHSSFLLFDDVSLKIEIEQFKQQNEA